MSPDVIVVVEVTASRGSSLRQPPATRTPVAAARIATAIPRRFIGYLLPASLHPAGRGARRPDLRAEAAQPYVNGVAKRHQGGTRGHALLDDEPVAGAATEGLRAVHLLRLR